MKTNAMHKKRMGKTYELKIKGYELKKLSLTIDLIIFSYF